jgi:bifunctional ADP-heptose synthase (sugar kinase/adenylyltransferase)
MFLRLDEGESNISNVELNKDRLNDISNFDIIIVSDYYKGFMTNDDLMIIGKHSKISILDSKRKLSKEIVNSFTFVKLNEKESLQNSDLLECENILVTLGNKGTKFNNDVYPSPNPQETIDVSGAGDTFTSAFILKYLENSDIKSSIIYANEMASIVVSKRGVATP